MKPHAASSFEQNAVQTMAAVTAPPVAPCACHYNTATEPLSPGQSQRPVSRAGYSTYLLQPGRPLFGSLRGQSHVPVSTHLLQPGCPLFDSFRGQSQVPVSTHLLQPGVLSSAVSEASLSRRLALICMPVHVHDI